METLFMSKQVEAGQAVYSKALLSVYDWFVLGFSNSYLWHCPTSILEEVFVKNATLNHLDIGVGTGYYPHKCFNGSADRRLALLDLNPNSLEVAAARISRFKPEIYRANILDPLNLSCNKFDSISMHYLLHCLPGSLQAKSVVFENVGPYLADKGVVFGSTILGKDSDAGFFAKKVMAFYNRKGFFDNRDDHLNDLISVLNGHFAEVSINMVGCVAVFACRSPRN